MSKPTNVNTAKSVTLWEINQLWKSNNVISTIEHQWGKSEMSTLSGSAKKEANKKCKLHFNVDKFLEEARDDHGYLWSDVQVLWPLNDLKDDQSIDSDFFAKKSDTDSNSNSNTTSITIIEMSSHQIVGYDAKSMFLGKNRVFKKSDIMKKGYDLTPLLTDIAVARGFEPAQFVSNVFEVAVNHQYPAIREAFGEVFEPIRISEDGKCVMNVIVPNGKSKNKSKLYIAKLKKQSHESQYRIQFKIRIVLKRTFKYFEHQLLTGSDPLKSDKSHLALSMVSPVNNRLSDLTANQKSAFERPTKRRRLEVSPVPIMSESIRNSNGHSEMETVTLSQSVPVRQSINMSSSSAHNQSQQMQTVPAPQSASAGTATNTAQQALPPTKWNTMSECKEFVNWYYEKQIANGFDVKTNANHIGDTEMAKTLKISKSKLRNLLKFVNLMEKKGHTFGPTTLSMTMKQYLSTKLTGYSNFSNAVTAAEAPGNKYVPDVKALKF